MFLNKKKKLTNKQIVLSNETVSCLLLLVILMISVERTQCIMVGDSFSIVKYWLILLELLCKINIYTLENDLCPLESSSCADHYQQVIHWSHYRVVLIE